MTHRFTNLLLVAGLSTTLGVLALSAQGPECAAKIPFTFHAGRTTLPAGEYRFSDFASGTLRVHGDHENIFMSGLIPADRLNAGAKGKLTFTCHGHDCVLTKIDIAGSNYSRVLPRDSVDKMFPRKLGLATLISVPLGPR